MQSLTAYSPYHFAAVRISLGAYLCVHFVQLAPWSAEMFSSAGVFPERARLLWMPQVVVTPPLAAALVWTLAALACLLAAGLCRRLVALILWYGWACLFHINYFIGNPSYPYVGWLLLAFALIPAGEPLALRLRRVEVERWELPATLFRGAWILLALGYCAGGIHKLGSPSWVGGTAMQHALTLPPLARAWCGHWLVFAGSEPILFLATWGIMAFEIGFPLLCLTARGRHAAWWSAVAMHAGILLALDLADLTVAMLLFHLFVYEPRWYGGSRARRWQRPLKSEEAPR